MLVTEDFVGLRAQTGMGNLSDWGNKSNHSNLLVI
jgi:hypothetical protein